MHRHAVGRKYLHLTHGVFHIFNRLIRKTEYQVHVYIFKAYFSCCFINTFYILNAVASSYQIKCFLVHGLRIYAYSFNAVFFHNQKLFLCYCIGSACLNCKFPYFRKIYIFGYAGKKPFKLTCIKRCWSSSANIHRHKFSSFGKLCRIFYFLRQLVKIFVNHFAVSVKRIRRKRTIKTACGAKRNTHVKAYIFIAVLGKNFFLGF